MEVKKGLKLGNQGMRTKFRPWTNQGLLFHTSSLSRGLEKRIMNHPLARKRIENSPWINAQSRRSIVIITEEGIGSPPNFTKQTGVTKWSENFCIKFRSLDSYGRGSCIWNVWERRIWVPWLKGRGRWTVTVISHMLDRIGVGGMGRTSTVIQRGSWNGMGPIRVRGNGISRARGFKDRGRVLLGRDIWH